MKKNDAAKFLLTAEDLKKLNGGNGEVDTEAPTGESDCWCNCHCMEASITGFQLGIMAEVGAGRMPNPCITVLSQIWGK